MLKNYFKTMVRNLWKNKTFGFLNIFGLAIGITCAGLIFLWTEDEMTFDKGNKKIDRLYQLEVNMTYSGNNFTMGSTPRPMAAALKAEIPGIINTSRISDNEQRLLFSWDHKSLYAAGCYTDASLFNMFTFDFIQGNAKDPFPQLYSIIITASTARKFFGEEKNVIGKMVRVDNKHEYVVSGVVKDMPENSTLQFEWLAPYEVTIVERRTKDPKEDDAVRWDSYGPLTYVEVDQGAKVEAINRQLKDFIHRQSANQKTETFLFPMKDWRLYSEFANGKPSGDGRIKQVHLLSAIAWIILLIACINFMNLATASSQRRAREVGVRKVLGAERKRLVVQFMSEAFFMSLLAAVFAIIIMALALPAFNMLMQKHLSLHITNPFHLFSLLLIALICGLVAGSYPALYLSAFNPVYVLKGLKIKAGGAAFVRKGLVVFQFTISVVFIVGTVIVYQQIQYIKNRDLGFNKDNLIEINPQHAISGIFTLIKGDLLHTGLIEDVAIADHSTLYGGDTDDKFKWQGKLPDNHTSIAHRNVSPEYVSTSGMKIMEGRDFNANGNAENADVLVNESMAKMMGKESAVGKIIQSPRGNPDGVFSNMTVIGVVKDYVYGNIYVGKASPLILFCRPPEFSTYIYARTKSHRSMEQVLAKIEEVMKKDNPAYPLEYKFVDDQFNRMFQNESQIGKVAGVFASLAIIISCLGLFGLAAYTAEQRTKEIGIRKVLGASVTGVAGLLSKDFLQLVGLACLIAFPFAWWIMANWLQGYEYRVGINFWVFVMAGMTALLIAIVTIGLLSIKAAMANPVKSLKSE